MNRPTRVYVVFLDEGYDHARLHFNRSVLTPEGKRIPRNFVSNADVVAKLHEMMPEVEFVKRDLDPTPTGYSRLLSEIQQFKDTIDGLVLIGRGRIDMQGIDAVGQQPLAFTGLPTIHVDNLMKLQPAPYRAFKENGRVVLAELDREGIMPPEKSQSMFQDLAEKIRLFDALHRLRESEILMIKDPDVDIDIVDFKVLPPRYNEMIVGRIKECFGTEFVFRDLEELVQTYRAVTDEEARPIAEKWIAEAEAVQPGIEGEILRAARVYVALERIVEKAVNEKPAAVMVSDEYMYRIEEGVTTTTSLAMTEFQKQGIIGCYGSYTGTTLAQLLGYYAFGRMSYVHDMSIDIANNVTLHMHCGTPINDVWGTENLRYKIRDYTTGKWREDLKRRDGAVPAEVSFPVGVPVTIWKVFPLQKLIILFTGVSLDGAELYREWEDLICRNKLPLKVEDAEKIAFQRDTHRYGCHFVATFGDLRNRIKQLATFIGFEVEEWDR